VGPQLWAAAECGGAARVVDGHSELDPRHHQRDGRRADPAGFRERAAG